MQRRQTLDLADYLDNNQRIKYQRERGNPFQLDINYHGFHRFAVARYAEGLSVYVDGVRVNGILRRYRQLDLIPESAISTVTLMSGSNPVFGLNTLGGASLGTDQEGHETRAPNSRPRRLLGGARSGGDRREVAISIISHCRQLFR